MLKSTWELNSAAVRKSIWKLLYSGPIFDPNDFERGIEDQLGARPVYLSHDPILKIYHLEKCTIKYKRTYEEDSDGITMIEGFGTEEDLGEVVSKLEGAFPNYEFNSL